MGTVFSREHMEEVLAFCDTHQMPLVSDEVYHKQTFTGVDFHSFGDITENVPVLVVSGYTADDLEFRKYFQCLGGRLPGRFCSTSMAIWTECGRTCRPPPPCSCTPINSLNWPCLKYSRKWDCSPARKSKSSRVSTTAFSINSK